MSMVTITGGGAFTSKNISDINSNFAAIGGGSTSAGDVDLWVRPSYGNDNNVGSYDKPFATMSGCSRGIVPGVVIGVQGVITEEFSSPMVNDVTIVGFANRPRQATTSSIPNGGGATWLSSSASATASLLQINGQGWLVQNLFFASGAGVVSNPTIKIVNAGDPPTANCGEKTSIVGCFITGTDDAIGAVDLPNNVLIRGNTIFSCSGSGDLGISSAAGLGTGTLNNWVIEGNDFLGNAGHITGPFTGSTIRNNHFSYIYNGITSTTQVVLTSGANNSIYNNRFDVPFNVNGLTAMFGSGTNDRWGSNSMGTAVLTPMTGLLWGVPVSGAA